MGSKDQCDVDRSGRDVSEVAFVIEGAPVPWKRARRSGERYFDSQTRDKNAYAFMALNLRDASWPLSHPVYIECEFHFGTPKSWSKNKKAAALGTPHASKPDLDNLVKFILDALNGIVWKDDAVIAEIHAKKVYSSSPKTSIIIRRGE